MKKFRIKYYELTVNENGEQYDKLVEKEIEATNFEVSNHTIFFRKNSVLVAAFSGFVSVERIEED